MLKTEELYAKNTIAAKTVKKKRNFYGIGDVVIVKEIDRTSYLKICWMCGKAYESYKINSFACQHRCSQNIIAHRKRGLDPIANMTELTKPKNVKSIKEQFDYR